MRATFLTGGYAGRGEAGVCRVAFDSESGFSVEAAMAGLENPSCVLAHPGGRVFYAVEEVGEGTVRACRLDGPLSLGAVALSTGGAGPCHLSLSGDLTRLYAANYASGSLAVFALDGAGNLLERADLRVHAGSGPDPRRQEAAHVHFSAEIDGLVYVCDLGMDRIFVYRWDGGRLSEAGRIAMPPGSGPRHLAHSPQLPGWLYCVAELDSRVYAIHREAGGYRVAQSRRLLPEHWRGESIAAVIRFSADGALLLASNRGHDSIAVMPVAADGTLGQAVISRCVAQPRDFIVRGDWVLAASQRDSVLRAFRLDRQSLRLEDSGMSLALTHPVCLCTLEQ